MTIYLLHGDEVLLIEEAAKAITTKHPDASVETLSDNSFERLQSLSTATGLFASQTLIMAKNPWFLKGSPSDKDISILEASLEALKGNGNVFVMYCTTLALDKRKKAFKLVKKYADIQEFKALNDWDMDKVLSWVKARAQKEGKAITDDAVEAIAAIGGTKLQLLAKHIEAAVTYIGKNDTITLEDIHSLSADTSASAFDVQEALRSKNKAKLVSAGKKLLASGEDPVKLLGLVASSIRLFLQISLLNAEKQSVNTMASKLGKNPYYLKRLVPEVTKKYSTISLKKALFTLSDCDLHIKSGTMNPRKAFEFCLSRLF